MNDSTPLLRSSRGSAPAPVSGRGVGVIVALLAVTALLILFVTLYALERSAPNPHARVNFPKSGKLKLHWADEFHGSRIDESKWVQQEMTGAGSGNNERQVYVKDVENTFVADGYLTIKATETPQVLIPADTGLPYTARAGKIYSREHFFYGYTEVRANLPVNNYMLPAIWFFALTSMNNQEQPNLPTSKYVNWPRTGEIDLVEVFGTTNTTHPVFSNIFGGGPDFWLPVSALEQHPQVVANGAYTDFHTYGLEWTPDLLRFWLDATVENGAIVGGTVLREFRREDWQSFNAMGDTTSDGWPFDQPLPITANLAVIRVGGIGLFPQNPNNDVPNYDGAEMQIDFVRNYRFDGEQNIPLVPRGIASSSQPTFGGGHTLAPTKKRPVKRSHSMNAADFIHHVEAVTTSFFRGGASRMSAEEKTQQAHAMSAEFRAMFNSSVSAYPPLAATAAESKRKRTHAERYTLSWSDEFQGRNLDAGKWRRREASPAVLDFLCAASAVTDVKNSFVSDAGHLVIQATEQDILHPLPYYQRYFPFEFAQSIAKTATAQVESLDPIVGYGYFEIRAKIPVVDSVFTKIELNRLTAAADQPSTIPYGQILVTGQSGLSNPGDSIFGISYGGPFDAESRSIVTDYARAPVANRADWHTYGVEIRPGLISWYVDAEISNGVVSGGTLLGQRTSDDYYTVKSDGSLSEVPNTPFDKKMFLRIAVIPGGDVTGFTPENSYQAFAFPASSSYPYSTLPNATLQVDFVRFHRY